MAVHPETYLSTFSGIGALDLAISRVFPASRCLAYVEGEAYAAAVLAARMETGDLDDAPIWSDIRTFPTGALTGRVDLVVGGFPCQDLSLAGKRAGIDGARSGLYFDLIRIVRDVRPRYVFLENVAALTAGRTLDAVLGALAEVGLDAEWGCLRASDVGAPHRRDRWFCLAWDRQLADAGRASVREPAERQHEEVGREQHPGVAGPESADAARLQRPGRGRGLRDGRGVREVRQAVDDALCGRHGHQDEPLPAGWDCAVVACNDSAVGDTGHCNSARRAPEPRREQIGRTLAARSGEPMGARAWPGFPPGPGDRDGWAAYLEAFPDLAPATQRAVRGGADGPSVRVDRLRALGNAVVPDQAEWALRLLWFRAFGVMP